MHTIIKLNSMVAFKPLFHSRARGRGRTKKKKTGKAMDCQNGRNIFDKGISHHHPYRLPHAMVSPIR